MDKDGLNSSGERNNSDSGGTENNIPREKKQRKILKNVCFMMSNVTNFSFPDNTLQMFCFWEHMLCSTRSLCSCTHYPLWHEEESSVTVYMKTHSFSFCSYPEKQMSTGTFTSHTGWHQTRSWHPVSTGNWWAKCKLTRSQHSSAWLSAPSNQG